MATSRKTSTPLPKPPSAEAPDSAAAPATPKAAVPIAALSKASTPKPPAPKPAAAKRRTDKPAEPKRAVAKPAAKEPVVEKSAKPAKAAKLREALVRDSFTMPASDFALIAQLKQRALNTQRAAKKSELLRAGLQALAALEAKALVAALDRLAPIKTGRPKKGH